MINHRFYSPSPYPLPNAQANASIHAQRSLSPPCPTAFLNPAQSPPLNRLANNPSIKALSAPLFPFPSSLTKTAKTSIGGFKPSPSARFHRRRRGIPIHGYSSNNVNQPARFFKNFNANAMLCNWEKRMKERWRMVNCLGWSEWGERGRERERGWRTPY